MRGAGIARPQRVATDSPRRRLQLALRLPGLEFTTIRGNVDTRLRKIADGLADATVLAAAGLARLGIGSWPGLEFHPFAFNQMVPAVGQGAIAVQCRAADAGRRLPGVFDGVTERTVAVERALQTALGGGCPKTQPFGAHATAACAIFLSRDFGRWRRTVPLAAADFAVIPPAAAGRDPARGRPDRQIMNETDRPSLWPGRRVVVTRTREQASVLGSKLSALGAEVLELPVLRITRQIWQDSSPDIMLELGSYDWLVFTSANGVRYFFEEFFRLFDDIRSLGLLRIASVGDGTARRIQELHLKVECQPETATSEALAEALIATGSSSTTPRCWSSPETSTAMP